MAKTATKKAATPRKQSDESKYPLNIDRELWALFMRKAVANGRTAKWLLERFISSYAKGEPLNLEGGA